jgi:hypothetical protein
MTTTKKNSRVYCFNACRGENAFFGIEASIDAGKQKNKRNNNVFKHLNNHLFLKIPFKLYHSNRGAQ